MENTCNNRKVGKKVQNYILEGGLLYGTVKTGVILEVIK